MLNTIDEYTRECLLTYGARKITVFVVLEQRFFPFSRFYP